MKYYQMGEPHEIYYIHPSVPQYSERRAYSERETSKNKKCATTSEKRRMIIDTFNDFEKC
jgi:hypothetical protein